MAATTIPQSTGVPGKSDAPNWIDPPPTGDVHLDDVRWTGSHERTFGGSGAKSASFRGTYRGSTLFLSFRAAWAQDLRDEYDFVYLCLQKKAAGTQPAMVIPFQVHPQGLVSAGPPSVAHPQPVTLNPTGIFTSANGAAPWTAAATPTWVSQNARGWLQVSTDPDVGTDTHNRWAVQVRVPIGPNGSGITNGTGPDLGSNFYMWYVLIGTLNGGPVILADSTGVLVPATFYFDLTHNNFPAINQTRDEYQLTPAAATSGGIAIYGNGYSDIRVYNTKTNSEGTLIANGLLADGVTPSGYTNTFIARPRNYSGQTVHAADINATFRWANWGSLGGDPHNTDFNSGTWPYVPGNDAVTPVNANTDISAIVYPANPTGTPITLQNQRLDMTGRSLHQCILVTLSGSGNLTFLNNSAFQNMDFDHASQVEREAQISLVGVPKFSEQPRDVYLGIEKVNMPKNAAPGTNEGRFLEASVGRLMHGEGPLAAKLRTMQAILSDQGDFGSAERLDQLLKMLLGTLSGVQYRDAEGGKQASADLVQSLRRWLLAVKENDAAAARLAPVFQALGEWLAASGLDTVGKLKTFIDELVKWQSGMGNDPASRELGPGVVRSVRQWLFMLPNGDKLAQGFDTFGAWFSRGRPAAELPAILAAMGQLLTGLLSASRALGPATADFAEQVAAWLKGSERLTAFVDAMDSAGLTQGDLDQFVPSVRIHVYRDTGERVKRSDGVQKPVLRAQSSFGFYAYHEGPIDGWQTAIEGADRIAENLYVLRVPNDGTAKITTKVQGAAPGEDRMPEDPIKPQDGGGTNGNGGCLEQLLRMLGLKK